MTDYRALCARMADELDHYRQLLMDDRRATHALAAEARAALEAQPEPQAPTVIGPEWQPCVKLPITVHVREQRPGETHSSTREGITPLRPDDLIMRGVRGEEYPIGRELFNQTYRMGAALAQPEPPSAEHRPPGPGWWMTTWPALRPNWPSRPLRSGAARCASLGPWPRISCSG